MSEWTAETGAAAFKAGVLTTRYYPDQQIIRMVRIPGFRTTIYSCDCEMQGIMEALAFEKRRK